MLAWHLVSALAEGERREIDGAVRATGIWLVRFSS